jgi:hypothetical protein
MIGTSAPAAIGPVRFPREVHYDDGTGETLPVYMSESPFVLPIAVAPDAAPGVYSVR